MFQDLVRPGAPFQAGAGPDVIEAAAAIGGFPIAGAIAPPAVNLFLRRNEMPGGIDPVEGRLGFVQQFGFHRRVADDVEQLLVAPHIVFQRRDIQVAHQNDGIVPPRFAAAKELFHLLQEVQLVGEFAVRLGIGNVAAGG